MLVEDASRGITKEGVDRERQAWTELGVSVARTDDIVSMLKAERRTRPTPAPRQVSPPPPAAHTRHRLQVPE